MKTGKKILIVMMTVVFMLVAGVGLAHAESKIKGLGKPPDVVKEVALDEQIAADLKSGKSLQDVMAKAAKKGISIGKVVEACNLAVKENKEESSPQLKFKDIIQTALDSGATLKDVVLAAKSAGMLREQIASAARNPNKDRTGKEALAILDKDNTLSYTPPAYTTNTSTDKAKISFTYTIINTGGNTPSTKIGSPM